MVVGHIRFLLFMSELQWSFFSLQNWLLAGKRLKRNLVFQVCLLSERLTNEGKECPSHNTIPLGVGLNPGPVAGIFDRGSL